MKPTAPVRNNFSVFATMLLLKFSCRRRYFGRCSASVGQPSPKHGQHYLLELRHCHRLRPSDRPGYCQFRQADKPYGCVSFGWRHARPSIGAFRARGELFASDTKLKLTLTVSRPPCSNKFQTVENDCENLVNGYPAISDYCWQCPISAKGKWVAMATGQFRALYIIRSSPRICGRIAQ
jgi:hypothetical protein